MAEQLESEPIGLGQKLLYFAVIPLIFTTLLASAGAIIIQQGKGKSFSDSLLHVGKAVSSGTQNAVGLMSNNKTAAGTNAVATTDGTGTNSTSKINVDAGVAATPALETETYPATSGTIGNANGVTSPVGQSMVSSIGGTVPSTPSVNEEFKQKIDEVAAEYSKMPPKQAGAIISAMSQKDAVFTMVGMKPQQRAAILAVMDPKKAAEITRSLQDFPTGNTDNADKIHSKLNQLPDTQTQTAASDEFILSFNQMPAHSTALLITELMKSDPKKALKIAAGMDSAARAQMLSDLVSSSKTNPDGVRAATAISESLSK